MFLKHNLFTLIWAFFILLSCIIPGKELPDLTYWELLNIDKLFHLLVFCIFSFLMMKGFVKQYSFVYLRYNPIKSSLIIGVIYGGLTESLQSLSFIGRTASIFDFIANTIGCLVGIFAFGIIYKTKPV